MTNKITLDNLRATYKQLGFPFFENGNFNLNLGIIRSDNRVADAFDDIIYCAYKQGDVWKLELFPATADPGVDHLVNPVFPEAIRGGSAILAEGFYRKLWTAGWFKGKVGLRPLTKVRVYSDKNRDNILDLDPSTIEEGDFGIWGHVSFQGEIAQRVGLS